MTLNDDPIIQDIASDLFAARSARRAIPAIRTRLAQNDLISAYQVQKTNCLRWQELGAKRMGYKIGLTSKAIQQQLNVTQPDFGVLFDFMDYRGNGARLSVSDFIAPRLEAEIALMLRKDITDKGVSRQDLISAIYAVACAAEICDCALTAWNIDIIDMIADNSFAAGFAVGPWVGFTSDMNLEERSMSMLKNGLEISKGIGAATLGSPLNALAWLAEAVIDQGDFLRAGDIILSGALGPMKLLEPGDYSIHIEGFDTLRLQAVA